MLATARTYSLLGVDAREVRVEVDVASGLPVFSLVGLPDTAVRESRERVRAALTNSGFAFPLSRITASLAPADLRKAGPGFDLAIATGLLAASGQLPPEGLGGVAVAAELALDGSLRPIPGTLAMAQAAADDGVECLAVAAQNAPEASLVPGVRVLAVERLEQLVQLFRGEWMPEPADPIATSGSATGGPDLADLRGQPFLRRGLEVAAAGGHHLLTIGPAGSGKSLALRRLPSIMPPLGEQEVLEVLRIAGVAGRNARPGERPFRAPHHSISRAGLVGGGNPPRPGEITLAHRGVLFLDELPEFDRSALEAMRVPMEEGRICVVRVHHAIELPCSFQLVAAANPCPCGRGASDDRCTCDPLRAERYLSKVSGALADRIDIAIGVRQPTAEQMAEPGEPSDAVRDRVVAARERAEARLGAGRGNAEMTAEELRAHVRLTSAAGAKLAESQRREGLSGRGHDKVMRIAQTVADLAGSSKVGDDHVLEALALRLRSRG